MSERTHFGFEEVSLADKKNRVKEVFSSVATRYDVMNDLMSMGLHRWWKIFAVTLSKVKAGDKILDIATGTGDLARAFAKRGAQVWASDINADMLILGRNRNLDAGLILPAIVANAEKLPFGQAHFDCVSVAFGLRNMTDKDQALREMKRVLKPGGRILVLEFSQVWKPLEPLYDWYSFKAIPKLGAKIAGDEKSYRYLAESIRRHPDQRTLSNMMQQAGFEQVTFYNLCAGIVALHLGTCPA